MQTNAEAKRQAIENLDEIRHRFVDLVTILATLSALKTVTPALLEVWQKSIDSVLQKYQGYLETTPTPENVTHFNLLADRIKVAFTPTPRYRANELHEIVIAYSELAREITQQMPQAFITSENEGDSQLEQ